MAENLNLKTPHAIEVAAGLVFRDGQLLITQRRVQDHLGGLWEFPGGKRESNESFEASLQRELREELGIEVAVGKLFETITHDYAEKSVQLCFFCCRWLKHEPTALGCQAFAWIKPSQLRDYVFPPADARLLQRLSVSAELWR